MRSALRTAGAAALAAGLVAAAVVLFARGGGFATDRAAAVARFGGAPSRFLVVDGTQLHVRDEGQGPPLLLLHGSRASLHQWDGWVGALAAEFRVIRVDGPGHGLAAPLTGRDLEPDRHAELLRGLLDALGVERAHVGGTSTGAVQAVHFAARYPQRVAALVLSTVPLKLPAAPQPAPLGRRLVFQLHDAVLGTTATRWYWRSFLANIYANPAAITAELVDRYRMLNGLPGRADEQARLIRNWYARGGPARDAGIAATVTAPVLLQWGAAGPVLPPALQCEVAALFAAAQVRVLAYPDLGHKLVMEDPVRTARDAARFLAGEPVGAACDPG